jgi:hypothetical protein
MRALAIVHQPDAGPGVFARALRDRDWDLVPWLGVAVDAGSERASQRPVGRLALALLDDLASETPEVRLGRAVAAHVDSGAHRRDDALGTGQLDPRSDLLDRIELPELDVDGFPRGRARELSRASLRGVERVLKLVEPGSLDAWAGAHSQLPGHAAIIAGTHAVRWLVVQVQDASSTSTSSTGPT